MSARRGSRYRFLKGTAYLQYGLNHSPILETDHPVYCSCFRLLGRGYLDINAEEYYEHILRPKWNSRENSAYWTDRRIFT